MFVYYTGILFIESRYKKSIELSTGDKTKERQKNLLYKTTTDPAFMRSTRFRRLMWCATKIEMFPSVDSGAVIRRNGLDQEKRIAGCPLADRRTPVNRRKITAVILILIAYLILKS